MDQAVDPNLPLSHSGFPFPLLLFRIRPFVPPAEKIRERQRWEGLGSLAPLPHLADEETDSEAVTALLRGTEQVMQNEGGWGRIPAWRMLRPHLSQAAWGHGWTAGLGTQHLGPDSDSATHRVTLDMSCPSLGSSCSSSMTRALD